ncbi:MAG: S66 family peptidase [bacterium]
MRFPKTLPPGGTIGFIAPSFGAYIEPYHTGFLRAIEVFERMGYRTWLGPNVFKGDGIGISTDPASCGRELTEAMSDPALDAVITTGGGELMCEALPYVDFKKLKAAPPKWYMGYSDNTNYTFLSATLMDTAAVYGPCAHSFAMEPLHESLADALSLLRGEKESFTGYKRWEKTSLHDEEHPFAPYNLTEKTRYTLCPEKRRLTMAGRLLGGCVDVLVNLCGTPWDRVREFNEKYRKDGVLWFLECCDLRPFDMRRALWHLREAGWFEAASGFLIGRPLHFDEVQLGLDRFGAVVDILKPLGKPILLDADLGHLPPSIPLITGAKAKITASKTKLTIEQVRE